jgi:apolipoprotein N-acyltransferase
MGQETTRQRSDEPKTWNSQFGFIAFVALYFGALLWWFGSLFAGGGSFEHAVMAVIVPLVLVLGILSVGGFTLIALEGRRAARAGDPRSKDLARRNR